MPGQGDLQYRVQLTKQKENETKTVSLEFFKNFAPSFDDALYSRAREHAVHLSKLKQSLHKTATPLPAAALAKLAVVAKAAASELSLGTRTTRLLVEREKEIESPFKVNKCIFTFAFFLFVSDLLWIRHPISRWRTGA